MAALLEEMKDVTRSVCRLTSTGYCVMTIEKLTRMVNDIIEELSILEMEPKLASLRWTSTFKEHERTLKGGELGKIGMCRSWTRLTLVCRFRSTGKGVQGTDKTLREGLGSWWRDAHINRAKSVSLRRTCDRVQ